jgi:hypothetical protein
MADNLPDLEGGAGGRVEARPVLGISIDSAFAAVPAGTANGAPLSGALARPAGSMGVIFEIASGEAVTYAIAAAQPEAPPTPAVARSGDDFRRVQQPLGPGMMIYVTTKTGSPVFQWI